MSTQALSTRSRAVYWKNLMNCHQNNNVYSEFSNVKNLTPISLKCTNFFANLANFGQFRKIKRDL